MQGNCGYPLVELGIIDLGGQARTGRCSAMRHVIVNICQQRVFQVLLNGRPGIAKRRGRIKAVCILARIVQPH
jgi:hypothetical protein